MTKLLNRVALSILVTTVLCVTAGCSPASCDSFSDDSKVVRTSTDSSFRISVPNSWSVENSRNGEAVEMLVKASGSCKIRILLASRLLDTSERAHSGDALMSAMLSSSIEHLKSQGHTIENYGKYKPFKLGAPTFVIVSQQPDKQRIALSYASVSDSRNLSIVVLSRDSQKSEAVGELLREIVDSVAFE